MRRMDFSVLFRCIFINFCKKFEAGLMVCFFQLIYAANTVTLVNVHLIPKLKLAKQPRRLAPVIRRRVFIVW